MFVTHTVYDSYMTNVNTFSYTDAELMIATCT